MRTIIGLLLLACLGAGCSAPGPSLRALNSGDAHIVVRENGDIEVWGKPVPLAQLDRVILNSSTDPEDPILVRLMAQSDTPTMQQMRKYIARQMVNAKHLNFAFVSEPRAILETHDRKSGKVEITISDQEVRTFSGAEIHAEADRMDADRRAYEKGTYVSDAPQLQQADKVTLKKVSTSQKTVAPASKASERQEELRKAYRSQQQRSR